MDNKKNIEQFDELFKQAFDGASNAVPPSVWQGVSSATTGGAGVASTSVLSKLIGLKGAAIVASTAIVVTSIVMLTSKEDAPTVDEALVENTTISESTNAEIDPTTSLDKLPIPNEKIEKGTETAEGTTEQTKSETDQSNTVGSSTNTTQTTSSDQNSGQQSDNKMVDGVDNGEISSNDQTDENEKLEISLWSLNTTCCLNQSMRFEVKSDAAMKSISWQIDGQQISNATKRYAELLFNSEGSHMVKVTVVDDQNRKSETTKTIQVVSANAGFDVEQQGAELLVSSTRPWSQNQWFVNQVMFDENRSTIVVNENVGQEVVIVHMVTGVNGCKDTAREQVVVKPSCGITPNITNVFTPYLKDGKNDEFVTNLEGVENYRMSVFRSNGGELIFETQNPSEGWNGQRYNQGEMMPIGWYIYRVSYSCGGSVETTRGRVLLAE